MRAFALNWNSCTFTLTWKKKNHYYDFVRIFFNVSIESVPVLGRIPVFFPVFIVPMKVCRVLVAISVDTKKPSKVEKVYEGAYSVKYIKHSEDRPKHEMIEGSIYIKCFHSVSLQSWEFPEILRLE